MSRNVCGLFRVGIWKLLTGTSVVLKLQIQLPGPPSQFVSICFLCPSAYGSRNGGVEIRAVSVGTDLHRGLLGRHQLGPVVSINSGIASISCGSFFQSSAASWKLFGQYFLLFPQHRFLEAFLQYLIKFNIYLPYLRSSSLLHHFQAAKCRQ